VPTFWTREACEQAINILKTSKTYEGALKKASKHFKRRVTQSSLTHALQINQFSFPSTYLGNPGVTERRERNPTVEKATELEEDEDVKRLVQAVKRKDHTLHSLCDLFELAPKAMLKLVAKAEKHGYSIGVSNETVAYKPVQASTIEAYVQPYARYKEGDELTIAIASDIHAGSRYFLREAFLNFLTQRYEAGIRHIFSPGDLLEGCYRHARWELSHHAWDEQAADFLEHLPDFPDLHLHFIDGNHDWTWTEKNGMESGRALVQLAKASGRKNLHFYGSRGALINFGGTRIELWHPLRGLGYAKSYPLQNHIRDANPRRRADILLAGHWHQYMKIRQQTTWAFGCGTFQHGDGPYGRALGGDTAQGGLTLTWRKDSDGVVRELSDTFHVVEYDAPVHHAES
jgi:hypothetical protein